MKDGSWARRLRPSPAFSDQRRPAKSEQGAHLSPVMPDQPLAHHSFAQISLHNPRSSALPTQEAQVGPEGGPLPAEVANTITKQLGHGEPLEEPTRQCMERSFGVSFAEVRVHRDTPSHTLNRQLSAQAFTHGRDIFLGETAQASNTQLLGHELTHVLQQRLTGSSGPLVVGPAHSPAEHEAETMGEAVASTETAKAQAGPVEEPAPVSPLFASAQIQRMPPGAGRSAPASPPSPPPSSPPEQPATWPTDAQPWEGLDIYDLAEETLPTDTFAYGPHSSLHPVRKAGIYQLVPQLRHRDDPHVVYYAAFSTRSQKLRFAVGPGRVEEFAQHWLLYMSFEGNYYGLTGTGPSPAVQQMILSWRAAANNDMQRASAHLKGAAEVSLLNPAWWLQQAAGWALAIAGGGAATRGPVIEATSFFSLLFVLLCFGWRLRLHQEKLFSLPVLHQNVSTGRLQRKGRTASRLPSELTMRTVLLERIA